MNQVYFYPGCCCSTRAACARSLNPFMNQVYFYTVKSMFKEFNEE